MESHISIISPPVVAIAGYLAYPKQLRIDPSLLYILSVFHNGFLVMFSAWSFITLSHVLYTDGLVFQSNYYFQNPQFVRVVYWFYISKYYEFFDTFLLYLNGKQPIFLQKFHHIGAVVCWHLGYIYKVDSVWVPTIANAFVHTVMYSYYLGCLLKVKQVRFLKQYITSMQLIQLFVPNFICMYFYRPPIETLFNYRIIEVFVLYVSILVVLFSQFYYNNYIRRKSD